MFVEYW